MYQRSIYTEEAKNQDTDNLSDFPKATQKFNSSNKNEIS